MCKNIKAQAKRNKNSDKVRNAQEVAYAVGDPVYLKNNARTGKLDAKWLPYYRIVAQTGRYSFVLQNQLTGKKRRAHAEDLRMAILNQWEDKQNLTKRKSRYVTVESDTDEESDLSSEEELAQYSDSDDASDNCQVNDPESSQSNEDAASSSENSQDPDKTEVQTNVRQGRTAKLNAQAKIKLLTELTEDNSSDITHLINSTVNTRLTDILSSIVGQLQRPT